MNWEGQYWLGTGKQHDDTRKFWETMLRGTTVSSMTLVIESIVRLVTTCNEAWIRVRRSCGDQGTQWRLCWVTNIQQKPATSIGAFHSTKIPVWNFRNSTCLMNGTFRLHKPVPSHRAFGYCSSTQDTKERYLGEQLCQMGKGHVGPTNRNERTGQSRQPSKMVPKYSNSGRI